MKKNLMKLMAVAVAVNMVFSPMSVLADGGVQSGKQTYDSRTSAWSGVADTTYSGKIKITYKTDGGNWTGPDGPNDLHSAGTFTVTIPTEISYTGMQVGAVDQSASYAVTVRGAIGENEQVKVTAKADNATNETDNAGHLSNGSDNSIKVTVSQNTNKKTKKAGIWTALECYGTLTDGTSTNNESFKYLSGTTAQDTITLSGEAKTAGTYTGSVTYTATKEPKSP